MGGDWFSTVLKVTRVWKILAITCLEILAKLSRCCCTCQMPLERRLPLFGSHLSHAGITGTALVQEQRLLSAELKAGDEPL